MEELRIIKTIQELEALKCYISDKDIIAFDTETTGTDREDKIIGFSICADIQVGYYAIIHYWDKDQQKLLSTELAPHIKDFLQLLVNKSLIMQNATFDCSMVEANYRVKLMPSVHTDTLALGHLLNENRLNGLKERGIELYGENAAAEQKIMKDSVVKNGGTLTKDKYELYKADADLIAHYGAKDSILTLKLFYNDVPILFEEGLDKFFYEEETMPLLRGPTYELNTTGLRVDPEKLQNLKAALTAECIEAEAFILKEIEPYVKEKYPGTKKTNHFNINSGQQLSWLLFYELENEFGRLTDGGKELCEAMGVRVPYSPGDKRAFISMCIEKKGEIWKPGSCKFPNGTKTLDDNGDLVGTSHKCDDACKVKGKKVLPKAVKEPWQYLACDEPVLAKLSDKYRWVKRLLEYKKNQKLLSTYVEGIQERMKYNIIRPSFLQHGTTSGRYSSRNPNFQNLPRDDKRVKSCIIARPGKVFVGADHSQLEPRVFASISGDSLLQASFKNGDDFYSVIGAETFDKRGCSLKKDDKDSFAKLYPMERHYAKQFGLASTYGATPYRLSKITGLGVDEMTEALNRYFERFGGVRELMLQSHEEAKKEGRVVSLFGRPRRMPLAAMIPKLFGNVPHEDLDYEYRNILNLAVNHKIQSTGASIMNRGAILVWQKCRELEALDSAWAEVKIVLQVHDQLVLEGPEHLEEDMKLVLRHGMETAVILPGVDLVADPFASKDLAGQK